MKIFYLQDKIRIILVLFIVSVSVIGFWLKFLISDSGFLFFGNSVYPIGSLEVASLIKNSLFIGYQPFAFGGYIPVGGNTISSYLVNMMDSVYLVTLSHFLSYNLAEKFYILTFNVFFGLTFYLLAQHILKNKIASMLSTLFILFNPFQVQLLAYGDTGQLEQMAFLFLSLSFFVQFVHSKSHSLSKLTGSIIFFILVYPFNQAFYLGAALFFVIILYKVISSKSRIASIRALKPMSALYAISILFILLAIIWPFLHGGYNILPGSKYAQPLSNFNTFSSSFTQVLILESYIPFVPIHFVASTFGETASLIWNYLFIFMLILFLAVQWIARYKPGMYLSMIILLASLIGSGSQSPISFVNIWLYLHFPGFQLLNTSYYWDWIIIAPLYAIELGFTYKIFYTWSKKHTLKKSIISHHSRRRDHLRDSGNRLMPYLFAGILLLVLATPISTQAYYDNNYIHSVKLPNDYYSLPSQLNGFNNNNYSGVAFFNPDNLLYFNDTTDGGFSSPFFNMIPFKTYGVPNYGAPPLTSTVYSYWVYSQFYHNKTRYVGDLLSLLGIKYFVVLYNTNSESGFGSFMPWSDNVNASHLMQYQKNVVRIYSSSNYSIYLNKYFTANYVSVSKMTLLLGNFNILNELAEKDVNLSGLGILFPWDLKAFNPNDLRRYVGNIIYQPNQLNLSITLDPLTTELNLIGSTLLGSSDFTTQWVPLNNVEGGNYVLFTLQNGIATDGNHTITVPLNINKTGNYTILIQAYRNSDGGNLSIYLNNSHYKLQTHGNNGTVWVNMKVSLTEGINKLRIQSVSGYNVIESAFFVPTTQFDDFQNALLNSSLPGNFSFISVNNLNTSSTYFSYVPIYGQLSWDGFSIGTNGNITVSHNQYFSTFSSTNPNYVIEPIFGGINFIVISAGSGTVHVDFYPYSFYILGYIVPSIAVASVSFISIIDYKRGST